MDSEALLRIAIYVCAAAATIFLVEAAFLAISRPIRRRQGINRRLRALGEGLAGEQVLLMLKAERGILTDMQAADRLHRLLVQSGLRITVTKFVVLMLVLALCTFAALQVLLVLRWEYCALIAAFVGFVLPVFIVRQIRSHRQLAFSTQLPDALDVVVRSLRSGHPVPVAFGMVSREMPDPVGSEFGIALDEMTYGLEMPRALRNLADRVGVNDLSLLVTAVSLQSTSGGNLSEVLSNLSKVIRSRFHLRRKVRSLSAEGRFSAYGLSLLPIAIFLVIFLQHPPYYLDIVDAPIFKPAMAAIIVWSFVGDLIMYKMINFKY
jgi:tight adherence protein B